MKKWGSVITAALLTLSLVVAGCANQGQSSGASGDEIAVGVLLPVTGNNATDGKDMQNAIEMAVKKVNDGGGVLGKKLKIEVADDGCDPQMATTAANKLVSQNVVAVVGGYCSGATLPSSGVFKNANIPMIVPAANSAKLPAQGLRHPVFD
ncbi:ABC transporter substrate-binding protein [Brevibacillus choshinensis]|uniref:ABC transporter substrate-binding protein n=1 Tax=Brevibacillus choshinensis TaxID=54911 RepID=UPI002E209F25|nr:ABC transporter substrate-binding protein [Brevibacillus choshinensis]